MSEPAEFLTAFAQALATMTLYAEGHPARERAIDMAYRELQDLQADTPHPLFTFLGDEIVFGRLPLRDLRAWDWSQRLAQAGIQRLEFADNVAREEFEGFLDELLARLTLSAIDTSEQNQLRRSSIRYGAVGVRGDAETEQQTLQTATISYSLAEETDTMRWMHHEVKATGLLPLAEAEAVVRSLSVAMHSGRQLMIPLLQLKEFDQYTTTHSLNVSVLAMALSEFLGLGREGHAGVRNRRIVARSREDPYPPRRAHQARPVHGTGAAADEPASLRRRPHHPRRGGAARPCGGGGVRASHHAERRRVPRDAIPARLPFREQAGARVRCIRRPADHAARTAMPGRRSAPWRISKGGAAWSSMPRSSRRLRE